MAWHGLHTIGYIRKFCIFIWQVSLVAVSLELKHIIETNLHNSGVAIYSHFFHCKSHLIPLYISAQMECLSYKDGCGLHVYRYLKEELAWTLDKQFWFTSNVIFALLYGP